MWPSRRKSLMDVKPCSDAWDVIVCRGCHLRVYVPVAVETFGDLRAYMTRTRP